MTGDAAVPPGDDDTTGHEIVTQCCNEIEWAFEEAMLDPKDLESALNTLGEFARRMEERYRRR